ncbi:DinB family protein [Dyadobacter sp. CY356]|uniref:DinB family protein n=1 Tax=Dyadobacter sp. CY356 TaxID=2906442 RepID=UPI001F182C56|nr:DinB family protein [Dyadobacter sp. CY356]MCF0054212.1 DinB family protein [Dyadobacter sp. CY356]
MMKKLLLSALLLFTAQTLFAQTATTKMIAEFERAKTYTKQYLDAMPEDGYAFKPTPDMRSFAQQMDHIADVNYAFVSAATGKASPFKESLEKAADQSKTAVTKTTLDSYDFIINALKELKDADLEKDVKVFGKDLKVKTAFEKDFEHQTHHRGQTTVYIRLKGVKPPQEMLF